MLKPIKKTRVYEDIIQQVAQQIKSGELAPGDKLPTERELVSQLGVSRASIREALRAMELLGLVESKVGDGTYVKSLNMDRAFTNLARETLVDDRFLLDMYDVRILLETYGARMAAKRRTDAQLGRMRRSIEALEKNINKSKNLVREDARFHLIIAEAAGNAALISVLSLCSELLSSSVAIADAYVNVLDIVSEHEAIYGAIERRDGKQAEQLMRAHIKRAHDRTEFVFKNAKNA
ncbi:MAG: FadR family transcriptional regulator [Spirochaetia bacterium]|jgi:GntR family transcriptional repressor for pyruvate dehydrogenase complex|nr:FadR family transcriptional regulator [Spirochaetia bacterium]